MTETTVSVTELARFCHRTGDIDSRFRPSPTGPEGTAGHHRLYSRRPKSYVPEFKIEGSFEVGNVKIQVRGRADGFDPDNALVEEIKTCRVKEDSIPPAVSQLHLAQGRLYASLIALEQGLPELTVQLTWFNIDTNEEYIQQHTYNAGQMQGFLDDSLKRYCTWLEQVEGTRQRRNASIETLSFPYGEFRAGQREIAELAYKCIDQGGQLVMEAPTGIGKTAATIYPALKAMGKNKHEKLAFVTAKTIGRLAAEDTLDQFRDKGLDAAALTLTAKERICFSPGKACHGDDCPYARGYYDKLPACMDAALERQTLNREEIESLSREHEVCPYELALDLLPWIDVIIADLHYTYSLYALLGTAMESPNQRWTILMDEAHNLPDRARGMYNARITKKSLMRAKRDTSGPTKRALEKVNKRMLALQNTQWQSADFHSDENIPEKLALALQDFTAVVTEAMGSEPALLARSQALADFFFDALHFIRVIEEWGDEYRLQLSRSRENQSLQVRLNCLDPARLLAQRQKRAHAVIAFSATLSPIDWIKTSLGLEEGAVCNQVASPFDPDQLQVHLSTAIDTRYRQREQSLPALAGAVKSWLMSTAGNCLVYFPSYRYMNDCLSLLDEPGLSRTFWVQEPEQADQARSVLLEQLEQRDDIAAFCILGGVLGEGIDLPGDQLSSVVVVGVGMPQVNRDTRELQSWYEQKTSAGFEYTFLYPGMQKVAQAIGRVIRTPEDRGSALLIDPRFAQASYLNLLPPWWQYKNQADEGHNTGP
jgi:DNA excision repair protein ERCC-2